VQGWPRLAARMAKNPHLAAFSRFGDLNVKSLLYYQSELTRLRMRLHKQEYIDASRTDDFESTFASRADFLIASKDSKQFKLMEKIRSVLKEYSKSLNLAL